METRDLRPDWLLTAIKIPNSSKRRRIAPKANTSFGYLPSSKKPERDKLCAIYISNCHFFNHLRRRPHSSGRVTRLGRLTFRDTGSQIKIPGGRRGNKKSPPREKPCEGFLFLTLQAKLN